jgi:hypothetical protein
MMLKRAKNPWTISTDAAPASRATNLVLARTLGTVTTSTETALRKNKTPEPAVAYNWATVYAVVKASSDRIVREALAKFGVKATAQKPTKQPRGNLVAELQQRVATLQNSPLVKLRQTRDYMYHFCDTMKIVLSTLPSDPQDWAQEFEIVARLHAFTTQYIENYNAMKGKMK